MKTETQAVADAFETVSSDASYRGRWVQDSNYIMASNNAKKWGIFALKIVSHLSRHVANT
jgi:HD-GYP domain-containing protein (c-di-GMP phosphodiesterase class II)